MIDRQVDRYTDLTKKGKWRRVYLCLGLCSEGREEACDQEVWLMGKKGQGGREEKDSFCSKTYFMETWLKMKTFFFWRAGLTAHFTSHPAHLLN